MRATITARESSRRGEILKALIDLLQGDAGLQPHFVANVVDFEGLIASQVAMVWDVFTQQLNYTTYTSTESSVRLLAADNDFMPLLRMLVRLLPAQNPVSQSLWNAGITFDNLSPEQANALQTALAAAGAQVAITDGPAIRYLVSGQISLSDGRPWQEGGHLVQADDVVSATNSLPLGTPTAPSRDGRYTIPYTWSSTEGRNGPNLRVRLLNPEGTVIAEAVKPFADRQELLDLQVTIPAPPPSYTLTGTVIDAASGNPVSDAHVVALFESAGQTLARESASTLSTGEFSFPLDANLWADRPSGQPVAVSFQVSQNNQPLATDTRIPNLQPQDQSITVRVTVPTAEPEDPFIVQGFVSLVKGSAQGGGGVVRRADHPRSFGASLHTIGVDPSVSKAGQRFREAAILQIVRLATVFKAFEGPMAASIPGELADPASFRLRESHIQATGRNRRTLFLVKVPQDPQANQSLRHLMDDITRSAAGERRYYVEAAGPTKADFVANAETGQAYGGLHSWPGGPMEYSPMLRV